MNFCSVLAQKEYKSNQINIENVSNSDLVDFANNSEILSSIVTKEFSIRIFKVTNGLNYMDSNFTKKESDIVVAVTSSGKNRSKRMYRIRDIINPRDIKWINISDKPIFRLNHSSAYHTRTLKIEISENEIKKTE